MDVRALHLHICIIVVVGRFEQKHCHFSFVRVAHHFCFDVVPAMYFSIFFSHSSIRKTWPMGVHYRHGPTIC